MLAFMWKGREVSSISDMVVAMEQLESKGDARAFVQTYIETERALGEKNPTELVNENIQFALGYLGGSDREKIGEWLEVPEHLR